MQWSTDKAMLQRLSDREARTFTRGKRRHPRHAPARSVVPCHAIPRQRLPRGSRNTPARQAQHERESPCTVDQS
ncbi:hypothetical protein HZ326_11992 [Fusarium oxysporum f. sp. albedinis]|nr:hypothetical protein HZ326_11992 [Fusarium oxysporum f. sp. albedinis]